MADMLAWHMSKTFSGRTGHYRTAYQTKELLSLAVTHPSELWKECIYLAEAYQKERPRNLKKISKVSEDLRVDFENALVRVLRSTRFNPVYTAVVTSDALDNLSMHWTRSNQGSEDRERIHKRVVTNPELLSSNRVESVVELVVEHTLCTDILNKLVRDFEESVPDHASRERQHSLAVRNPASLSTKKTSDS